MQRYRRTLSFRASMLFCGLLICTSAVAVDLDQVDDFEDGTTQGWQEGGASPNPPTNVATGGPAGVGDNYLQNVSSGNFGGGGKLVQFNQAQWQGDYLAAGIRGILAQVKVISGPSLSLRAGFRAADEVGQLGWVSTTAVPVPADGAWHLVYLPIDENNLQNDGSARTYTQTMSNVGHFRIFHSTTAVFDNPDLIAVTAGFDNIGALGTLFQGWLWETGVSYAVAAQLDEEYCFGRLDFELAGDDSWVAGSTDEVCWGRTTTDTNPARSFVNYIPGTDTFPVTDSSLVLSTQPLVSAGGNLFELFGEEVGVEERLGTVLVEPSDGDLLIVGAADSYEDAFSGEGFEFINLFVTSSLDVKEARAASSLQGRWRSSFFDRLLTRSDVNTESVSTSIYTLDLQASNVCTFQESTIFQEADFDSNGDLYFATQTDFAPGNLSSRVVESGVFDRSLTGCTYSIDSNDHLAVSFTQTDSFGTVPVTLQFAVSDDNNYLVWAPDPDGVEEDQGSLQIGYRAASAMAPGAIDGQYLFYINITDFEATGLGHSMGATGTQEFDSQGRGRIAFDSTLPGTVPAGQSGNWFECEIEFVESGADYSSTGLAGAGITSTLEFGTEDVPFTACDYSVNADGGLLLNVAVAEPGEPTEEALVAGYINDNAEIISLINVGTDPAPPNPLGPEDAGSVLHILAMKYTGDGAANDDGDEFTNLEEFQLPLPPPEAFRRIAAVPNIADSVAPELAVALPGSLNGHIRDASTDTLIRDLAFNANRTPLDTGVADINGSPAFAALGQDATGRAWVEVRDALTGTLVRDVWFSSGYTPIALAVLPDMNGNNVSEVAVLLTKDSDNRPWVHIKDASTLAVVSTVWFQTGYTPLDLEFVPNVDANPGPELAVLMTRNIDGRTWVHVKDAQNGAPVKDVWYQDEHTPKDFAVIDNLDGLAVGSVDDFEDGTTQGWIEDGLSPNPPINIADGGPDGAGDNYLENASTGIVGPGGDQVMFNTSTWAGDYVAAGIQAIRLQAKVVSGAAASLRVAFGSNTGARYASTAAVNVPNDGNWHDVFLPILAGDLTLVEGAGTYMATMSAVIETRIMSAASPSWTGDTVAMTLGFDNIKAVPGADLAVLFVRDSDSRTWVHMKDAKTGDFVRNVWFESGFTPSRLEIIPDLNANTGDELAVLTTKDLDARAWVLVKDALSGAPIRNVWFQGAFAPQDFAVLPDMDANPGSELAVLGVKDSGQVQVEIKDAKTNAFINQVDFP